MNSIAALQRAFSKENVKRSNSRHSSKSNTPANTSPTTPIDDINREVQQFEGQFQDISVSEVGESRRGSEVDLESTLSNFNSNKADSSSVDEATTLSSTHYDGAHSSDESSESDREIEILHKSSLSVESVYPSPPPTLQPLALPPEAEPPISSGDSPPPSISEDETLVDEDTKASKPVLLSRTPSQRASCAPPIPKASYTVFSQLVESLPVRTAVSLFILIRKVLGYLGVNLRTSAKLESLLESHVPPISSHQEPSVPRIEVQLPVQEEKKAVKIVEPSNEKGWQIKFLRRSSSPNAAALSLKTRITPIHSPALSILTKPKFLVLDLDETLIHSTNKTPLTDSSAYNRWSSRNLSCRTVEVVLNGNRTIYSVYKRPWVDLFLKKVGSFLVVRMNFCVYNAKYSNRWQPGIPSSFLRLLSKSMPIPLLTG